MKLRLPASEQLSSRPERLRIQVLEPHVKVTCDADTDILTVVARECLLAESDAAGEVLAIEVLDATTPIENPRRVEFHEVA